MKKRRRRRARLIGVFLLAAAGSHEHSGGVEVTEVGKEVERASPS